MAPAVALADPLLHADSGPQPPLRGAARVAASAVLAVTSVAAVVLSFGGLPPALQASPGAATAAAALRGLPGVNASWATSAADVMVAHSAACYGFTGGTCLTESCHKSRNAVCQTGQCVCASGLCAGSDGVCGSEQNKPVASGFRLRNVKWPAQQLRLPGMSIFSQFYVSSLPDWYLGQEIDFNLYQLPGKAGGRRQYFLSPVKWPSWVASIRSTTLTAASIWGLFAVNLDHTVAPWDPQSVVVTVCSLRVEGRPEAVKIGSAGVVGDPVWAYVHHGSWLVYGWQLSADPGEGGFWVPSKPLEGLDDC